jgi:hypothetical protein
MIIKSVIMIITNLWDVTSWNVVDTYWPLSSDERNYILLESSANLIFLTGLEGSHSGGYEEYCLLGYNAV